MNSTYGNLSVTLSEGNLKYTTGTSVNPVTGTISIPTTGKWYWEVYVSAVGDAMIVFRIDQTNKQMDIQVEKLYIIDRWWWSSGSIYIEGSGMVISSILHKWRCGFSPIMHMNRCK